MTVDPTALRAAWPGVTLDAEAFLAGLGDEVVHVADLYLARACAGGDAAALRMLEERFLSAVPQFVARIDASRAFGDDVQQAVRTKLLLDRAIAEYAGRGALKSWIQVASIRLALNLRRGGKRLTELDDEADRILATPDPELAFIKERARADFRLAFQAALAELEPAERHLLRLHYLDHLTLSQIGAHEGVDKSTISRRLQLVRQRLLDDTHRLLRERLDLDEGELHSLMGTIASQLDVSIESFLQSR